MIRNISVGILFLIYLAISAIVLLFASLHTYTIKTLDYKKRQQFMTLLPALLFGCGALLVLLVTVRIFSQPLQVLLPIAGTSADTLLHFLFNFGLFYSLSAVLPALFVLAIGVTNALPQQDTRHTTVYGKVLASRTDLLDQSQIQRYPSVVGVYEFSFFPFCLCGAFGLFIVSREPEAWLELYSVLTVVFVVNWLFMLPFTYNEERPFGWLTHASHFLELKNSPSLEVALPSSFVRKVRQICKRDYVVSGEESHSEMFLAHWGLLGCAVLGFAFFLINPLVGLALLIGAALILGYIHHKGSKGRAQIGFAQAFEEFFTPSKSEEFSDLKMACLTLSVYHGLGKRKDEVDEEISYVLSCENRTGGFGIWPGSRSRLNSTYSAIEILGKFGCLDRLKGDHCNWLSIIASGRGGFRAPETARTDLESIFRTLALLDTLNCSMQFDKEAVSTWILNNYRHSQLEIETAYYTFRCLKILKIFTKELQQHLAAEAVPIWQRHCVNLNPRRNVQPIALYLKLLHELLEVDSDTIVKNNGPLLKNVENAAVEFFGEIRSS